MVSLRKIGSLWIETVGRATQDMRKPWSNGLAASYARAATIARNTRNGYRHALRMGLGAICIIIFIEARHAIFDVNILCPAVLLAIMVIDEQLRQWTPALPQKFND